MTLASITVPVTRGAGKELPAAVVVVKADGTEAAAGSDATAAKQDLQITQETAINTVLGTVTASPTANTIGDRLKTINTTLGSPLQANGNLTNIGGTISLPTGAATAAKQPALGTAASPSTDILTVQGGVAHDAVFSGNHASIGGYAHSGIPTAVSANGDTVRAWYSLNGQAATFLVDSVGAPVVASGTTVDGSAAPALSLTTKGHNYLFNGSTWDRTKKASAVSRIASAAATTNATSAKASAGSLHRISAYNTTVVVKFLKVYNKASAPTVGSDTPVMTLVIPPNGSLNESYPNGGLYFATGIAFALTGAAADADTTALSAGDVVGVNLSYD